MARFHSLQNSMDMYKVSLNYYFRAWHAELEKHKNDVTKNVGDKKSKVAKPNLRNVLIRIFGASLIRLGVICFVEECGIRYYIAIIHER